MEQPPASRSFLCVQIDDTWYGIAASGVLEVGRAVETTVVPGAPEFVRGVMGRGGAVIPVVDGGHRLHGDREAPGQRSLLVLLQHGPQTAGLLVDRIVDLVLIPDEQIDVTPAVMNLTGEQGYLDGVARHKSRIMGLLDVAQVVDFEIDPELVGHAQRCVSAAGADADDRPSMEVIHHPHLVVRVAGEEYALETEVVLEAVDCPGLERPARLPRYIEGLLDHRHEVIPVVHLGRRFQLHERAQGQNAAARLVVLQVGDGRFAVTVDALVQIVDLPPEQLCPAPAIVMGQSCDHIRGLVVREAEDRIIVVLDPSQIIPPAQIKRLRKLARSKQSEDTQGMQQEQHDLEVVVFRTAQMELSLPGKNVREIVQMPRLTEVPLAPSFICGVFHLRGAVLPVIDLRARLGMAGDEDLRPGKVLVVEWQGNSFALLIDDLVEIRRIASTSLQAPPRIIRGINEQFLSGIFTVEDTRTVLMLDPEVLFDPAVESPHRRSAASPAKQRARGGGKPASKASKKPAKQTPAKSKPAKQTPPGKTIRDRR